MLIGLLIIIKFELSEKWNNTSAWSFTIGTSIWTSGEQLEDQCARYLKVMR